MNTTRPVIEEWDNPAMAEFKRQEAKDREEFGQSDEAKEWLRRLRDSQPVDYEITLAPQLPKPDSFKLIVLPW